MRVGGEKPNIKDLCLIYGTSERRGIEMAKGKYKEWLKDENLIKIKGWAKSGLSNEQIAKNIGINVATLYEWVNKYAEIGEALKKNKEIADYEVENSLYERALGQRVVLKKPVKVKRIEYDPTTGKKIREYEEVVSADEEVYITPDTTAQIFWLKNRKPECWRNKPETMLENEQEEGGIIEIPAIVEESADE